MILLKYITYHTEQLNMYINQHPSSGLLQRGKPVNGYRDGKEYTPQNGALKKWEP